MIGLRLRAQSRERTQVQWGDVLGGEATVGLGGELVFRWPASPLRIAVEIDPVGAAGPVSIEFASEREVRLPAGPLGAMFAQQSAAGS
jgi:hypothetical protein